MKRRRSIDGLGSARCGAAPAPAASRTPTTSPTRPAARYVLTLFERLSADELPFYLHLMKHLAERGLPVPGPHADASGSILHDAEGQARRGRRPPARRASPRARRRDCASVGAMLARMHLGRRRLRAAPAEPARPGVVERDGAVVVPHLDADRPR